MTTQPPDTELAKCCGQRPCYIEESNGQSTFSCEICGAETRAFAKETARRMWNAAQRPSQEAVDPLDGHESDCSIFKIGGFRDCDCRLSERPAATPQDGTPDYTKLDGPALLEAMGDDAMKWAEAFRQHGAIVEDPLDIGWLVTWFANAIEHSSDVRRWRGEPQTRPVTEMWATPPAAGAMEALRALAEVFVGRPDIARLLGPAEIAVYENARRLVNHD